MALRRTRIGGSSTRRRQTLKTAWKHNSTTSAVYQKRQTLKYSWNKLPLDRLTFSLVSGRALCLFLSMVPIVYPVLHALIFLTFHRFDTLARHLVERNISEQSRSRSLNFRKDVRGHARRGFSFVHGSHSYQWTTLWPTLTLLVICPSFWGSCFHHFVSLIENFSIIFVLIFGNV